MWSYILKRLLHAIPILIGVNLITFALFFIVNSPDEVARLHLGGKQVSTEAIAQWKQSHGYDKPLFINKEQQHIDKFTDTIFFNKSLKLFAFDFGRSDAGEDISYTIYQRMWPSLMLAIPTLLLGLLVNITFALLMAALRQSYFDSFGVFICVTLMSISALFYIVFGQFVFGKLLHYFPISGYQNGLSAIKFVILPVLIGVIAGMGSGARWYRTLFLEEIAKDYVRTARAKGVGESKILFGHVLRNALIPILTGVVVILPLLFMGSLIMESFFGIPGLGSYTIDAINSQDFAIIRSMVFLGAVLYIIGLLLTDLSYVLVDPRVKLD